jgi:hypothetical protein
MKRKWKRKMIGVPGQTGRELGFTSIRKHPSPRPQEHDASGDTTDWIRIGSPEDRPNRRRPRRVYRRRVRRPLRALGASRPGLPTWPFTSANPGYGPGYTVLQDRVSRARSGGGPTSEARLTANPAKKKRKR